MPISYFEMRRRARKLRRNMTETEKRFWYDFFNTLPIRWQRQRIFGKYIADFYCHSALLVVEFDGAQHYEEKQKEYDKKRTAYFNQLGLEVMRFSNIDANRDFRDVCDSIYEKMKRRIEENKRKG